MSRSTIQQLVTQARLDQPCATMGHDWVTDGGRHCPRAEDCGGSQTVYRCAACGEMDYGEPGGPGYHECMEDGPCNITVGL